MQLWNTFCLPPTGDLDVYLFNAMRRHKSLWTSLWNSSQWQSFGAIVTRAWSVIEAFAIFLLWSLKKKYLGDILEIFLRLPFQINNTQQSCVWIVFNSVSSLFFESLHVRLQQWCYHESIFWLIFLFVSISVAHKDLLTLSCLLVGTTLEIRFEICRYRFQ